MVDKAYRNGKALNMASYLEIDAVIDPAETRAWLLRGLAVAGEPAPRTGASGRSWIPGRWSARSALAPQDDGDATCTCAATAALSITDQTPAMRSSSNS